MPKSTPRPTNNTAKAIENYLNSTYTQYHGGDDAGLKELKELAKTSPTPPAGFKIKSATEIATEKEEGLRLSLERISFWQERGAQLSDTVAGLVKRKGAAKPAQARGRWTSPIPASA